MLTINQESWNSDTQALGIRGIIQVLVGTAVVCSNKTLLSWFCPSDCTILQARRSSYLC